MPIQVACAQFAPRKADIDANLRRIAEIASQASGEGADLVVFPETATSGYFLEGGVIESALTPEALRDRLSGHMGGADRAFDLLVGFYLQESGTLYNAAAYLEVGPGRIEIRSVVKKFFLPTYGVFDEERFVSRGHDLGVVDTRFGKVAVLICEDAWHSILPTLCALSGASVMLVPSASPGRGFSGPVPDNLDRYRRLLRGIAEEHGVYTVNAMLCGFEGGKGFLGGSSVIDPFGAVVAEAPMMDENLLMASIDLDLVSIARSHTPLLSDLQSAWTDLVRLASRISPA